MSFNYVEHLSDGGYCMAGVSLWLFIKLLFSFDKRLDFFIQLKKGGVIWIYPFFKFHYEKPTHFEF